MKKLIATMVLCTLVILPTKANVTKYSEYMNGRCSKNCNNVSDMIHEAVQMASETYSVDKSIILAVIQVESKFNPKAENMSSKGLMQIHLKYHKAKFKQTNPMNVYANVYVGTSILKDCMDKKDYNLAKSLKCYNGGGDPKYVSKVLTALKDVKLNLIKKDVE
jgi:soluble lytic murein transglycosylase-like protein